MTRHLTFTVAAEEAGKRADVVVAEHVPDISRSLARALVDDERVRVNGKAVKPSHRVVTGDEVEVEVVLPASISAAPESIPLRIVYQDTDLAVIDKPAGMVVHPAAGHAGGTLANALAARFPQTRGVGLEDRPGIVHRLDKDTSGLMVVALNPAAHASLQRQIAAHTAGRRYLALAAGRLEPERGTIEAPIGRDPGNRKRMAVHGVAARPARTSYRVLEYLPGFSLLDVALHTGRTHQIRVHLAALGHPLAGDRTYHGAPLDALQRQFLHAYHLALRSPSTGRDLEFSSPLPADLEGVLAELRGTG